MCSARAMFAAMVSSALIQSGFAWMTDGVLPATTQFATYVGKFCFDYVPVEPTVETRPHVSSTCDISLITQLSEHACIFGKSFGCLADAVDTMWVSSGCRGDFSWNDAPLTCDSWGEQLAKCEVPFVPTSGYLEVEVNGQMLEEPREDPTQGHMFLMLFDDESKHWAHAKAHWDELTCHEIRDLANGAYPLSSELTSPPYNVRHVIRIREKLRPRFWHFAFVNCGAKNVLVPLTYTLHARNIRQGSDAEFGIDAYKSVPLELLFVFIFSFITLCALSKTWNRMHSRPLLALLCASASCSAAGCCLLAVHHKAYAVNGRGFVFAGALGLLCSCVSKALFMVLQFLIARGWALFFAPEDRGQLLFVIATLVGIAALSVGCEVHGWRVQDSTTDLYLYESWPGMLVICLNLGLLVVAWCLTLKSAIRETSKDVRVFYLRVSAATGIYFATLPVVCLLASFLVPWVRQKYTERVELCARCISTALLLHQLWPTHLDLMVGERMKGRIGSLTKDDEEVPAFASDAFSGDEEHALTSKNMGFEAGLLAE